MSPLGHDFFEVSRCEEKQHIRDRLVRAMEAGPVDLDLALIGDVADPKRELRMRILSARKGGLWLFVERDL